MVDISTVSIAIASASVVVGVVYYALQLRHQTKSRKTDTVWRVHQSFTTKEFIEATFKVWNLEFENYDDFLKKYGPPWAESPVGIAISQVGSLYEGAGELLYRGLTDYKTVSNIPTNLMWEKLKPIIDGARKQYNYPSMWSKFEYLYNEGKKREQQYRTKKG